MNNEDYKTEYKKEKHKLYYLLFILALAVALFWYSNHNYSTNFTDTLSSQT